MDKLRSSIEFSRRHQRTMSGRPASHTSEFAAQDAGSVQHYPAAVQTGRMLFDSRSLLAEINPVASAERYFREKSKYATLRHQDQLESR